MAGDAISGAAEEFVGMDVHIKFGHSTSNRSRDTQAAQFVMDERRTNDAGRPTDRVVKGR